MGNFCSSEQGKKLQAEFWDILDKFIEVDKQLALVIIQNQLNKAKVHPLDNIKLLNLQVDLIKDKEISPPV